MGEPDKNNFSGVPGDQLLSDFPIQHNWAIGKFKSGKAFKNLEKSLHETLLR